MSLVIVREGGTLLFKEGGLANLYNNTGSLVIIEGFLLFLFLGFGASLFFLYRKVNKKDKVVINDE